MLNSARRVRSLSPVFALSFILIVAILSIDIKPVGAQDFYHYFNLDRWDGPMYINIRGCWRGVHVAESKWGGSMGPVSRIQQVGYGSYRAWPSLSPRRWSEIQIGCAKNTSYPTSFVGYRVWYSGGYIDLRRIR